MQNLENIDVFEILITQKLLKCLKDPLSDPGSYMFKLMNIKGKNHNFVLKKFAYLGL